MLSTTSLSENLQLDCHILGQTFGTGKPFIHGPSPIVPKLTFMKRVGRASGAAIILRPFCTTPRPWFRFVTAPARIAGYSIEIVQSGRFVNWFSHATRSDAAQNIRSASTAVTDWDILRKQKNAGALLPSREIPKMFGHRFSRGAVDKTVRSSSPSCRASCALRKSTDGSCLRKPLTIARFRSASARKRGFTGEVRGFRPDV